MTKTSCLVMARRVSRSGIVRATISKCQCVECRGLVSASATKELDTDRDKEVNNLVHGLRDHVTVSDDRDTERTSYAAKHERVHVSTTSCGCNACWRHTENKRTPVQNACSITVNSFVLLSLQDLRLHTTLLLRNTCMQQGESGSAWAMAEPYSWICLFDIHLSCVPKAEVRLSDWATSIQTVAPNSELARR